jgi:hypothetical protein
MSVAWHPLLSAAVACVLFVAIRIKSIRTGPSTVVRTTGQ